MEGKVIRKLNILKGMESEKRKKLILCGLIGLTSVGDTILENTLVYAVNDNTDYLDQQEPFQITEESTSKTIEDFFFENGKAEYQMYVKYLGELYYLDESELKKCISDNLDSLLKQENIEEAIRIMIEQKIMSGMLKPKIETKEKKVRLTSYQYAPNGNEKALGGSIGLVKPYVDEGSIYFDENGYAMWKGGTTSKLNGKVYGKEGVNYLIVATATNALIGQYTFSYNDRINYYNYNDTFKIKITTPKGEKIYQAIVLDSCGACMDWSTTSDGVYAPQSEEQKGYCKMTNDTKIDIFTAPINYPNLEKANDVAIQIEEKLPEVDNIFKMPDNAKKYLENQYVKRMLWLKIKK